MTYDEEDINDGVKDIKEHFHYVFRAIEELVYYKVLPNSAEKAINDLAEQICAAKEIGHQWEFGGCNHIEHMYCVYCRNGVSTAEQVKAILNKHPFVQIGKKESDNPLFAVWEEFYKDQPNQR